MNQNINKLVFIAKTRDGLKIVKSLNMGRGKGSQPPKNNKTNNIDIKII